MPFLNWTDENDSVLLAGPARSGKRVFLVGSGYDDLPSTFEVRRRFRGLQKKYRERKNLPLTVAVGPALPTSGGAPGEARVSVRLPAAPRRLKWFLFFQDENGNSSNDLHVSRLGDFDKLGGEILGFGLHIPLPIRAAVDPDIALSILTPWGEGESDLHPYLAELALDARGDEEDDAESLAFLTEFFAGSLPQEPPRGWRFELEQERIHLDEGEATTVLLRIETPTPGATAFAVQMSAEVEGEQAMVATDPLVIRMPEDGSQGAELLGGGGEDGGDSELEQPEVAEETLGTRAVGA